MFGNKETIENEKEKESKDIDKKWNNFISDYFRLWSSIIYSLGKGFNFLKWCDKWIIQILKV